MSSVGLYLGSFDPMTHGHLYVIEKAALLVDTLLVRVNDNPTKAHTFSVRERLAMLRKATRHIRNVRCTTAASVSPDSETGLLFVIRGIRNRRDYADGVFFGEMMAANDAGCVLLFIQCPRHLKKISSSELKRRIASARDASAFAPQFIIDKIRALGAASKAVKLRRPAVRRSVRSRR